MRFACRQHQACPYVSYVKPSSPSGLCSHWGASHASGRCVGGGMRLSSSLAGTGAEGRAVVPSSSASAAPSPAPGEDVCGRLQSRWEGLDTVTGLSVTLHSFCFECLSSFIQTFTLSGP